MIDIHIHILAGIDDGAMDLEESLTMLARAETAGVSDLIATPHSWALDDMSKISSAVRKLNKAAIDAKLSVNVYEGCEFNVMRGEAIRRAGDGLKHLTLAGSKYLLTEFSNSADGWSVIRCLEEITAKGLVPIIAHPERITATWDDPKIMKHAKEEGALGQVSMGDVIGRNGHQPMVAALSMIEEGFCQFCATDAHTPDKLSLYVTAEGEIERKYGKEAANRLFVANPAVVLADGDISEIIEAIG